jgi:hypothetical protein
MLMETQAGVSLRLTEAVYAMSGESPSSEPDLDGV